MESTTEREASVERNNQRTRWFHAGSYMTVLGLLLTGWWLWTGQEGRPSALSRVIRISDTDLHTYLGWGLAAVAGIGVVLGWRAAVTLIRDSVRYRRGDLAWFVRWPRALVTGRFGRHDGHFDPGQRIANLAMILLLVALIVSGIGLVTVSGGPAFGWFGRIHRWATYLLTPIVIGHILVASGVLPGYRGVWRSMHFGGRLRERDAGRVWPVWLARQRQDEAMRNKTPQQPE